MVVHVIPEVVKEEFLRRARGNVDRNGHLETMCYLYGFKEASGAVTVTDMLVPRQTGTPWSVEDLGVADGDSMVWLMNSTAQEEYQERFSLLAWVHTHVRGTGCFFSSVDCHNQHLLKSVFPDVVGIVFSLAPDGRLHDWDAYDLTPAGQKKIALCGRVSNRSSILHDDCADNAYYYSRKKELLWERKGLQVVDARTGFVLDRLACDKVFLRGMEYSMGVKN